MDDGDLREIFDRQAGVIARRQVIDLGGADFDIRRMVNRREWARVHPGVFVNHTGPPTWSSRAWAAVLFHWPAALSHQSAVYLAGEVIHVAIERERTAVSLPGLRLHRIRDLATVARWNLAPPRVRFEEALLQLCAAAESRVDALALVSDAVQRRRTTVARVADAVDGKVRMRHRAWLRDALGDVDAGARSVLEGAYLRAVERAHGLPRGRRQAAGRSAGGVVYRDVLYVGYGLVVELDGRLGHEWWADRATDMDRDLVAAGQAMLTVRLGWPHVDQRPCLTAARLATALHERGWKGTPKPCGPGCALSVGLQPDTG